MANALATLFLNIRARSADLAIDLNKTTRKLQKVGRDLERTGSMLSRRFSLPLALGLAGSVKAFASFDKAMVESTAKMREFTGKNKLGIDAQKKLRVELEKTAQKIASETKWAADETAGAYKYLAEAGLDAGTAMKSLGFVAQFAQAGEMDLKTATDYLTDSTFALGLATDKLGKLLGPEKFAQNMKRVGNVITAASLKAATSIEQMMKALTTRSATEIKQAGLSIEDAAAALVVLAQNGIKGERAGHNLAVVLRDLQRKAAQHKEVWHALGIEVYDYANNKLKPLNEIMQQVEASFGKMTLEERNLALGLMKLQDRTQSQFKVFIGLSHQLGIVKKDLMETGDITKRIADFQMLSFSNQMLRLWAIVKVGATELGKVLAPVLYEIALRISNVAQAFADASPFVKKFTAWTLVLTTAIGPLTWAIGGFLTTVARIGGTFGMLLGLIGIATPKAATEATKSVGLLSRAFAGIKTAVTGMITVLASLPGFVATVFIAGIAATLYAFTSDLDGLSPRWQARFLALRDVFPEVTTALNGMVSNFSRGLTILTAFIEEKISRVVSNFQALLDMLGSVKIAKVLETLSIASGTGLASRFFHEMAQGTKSAGDALDKYNAAFEVRLRQQQTAAKISKEQEQQYKKISKELDTENTLISDAYHNVLLLTGGLSEEERKARDFSRDLEDHLGILKKQHKEKTKQLKTQKQFEESIDNIRNKVRQTISDIKGVKLEDSINKIIEAGTKAGTAFEDIKRQIKEKVWEGAYEGLKKGIAKATTDNKAWQKYAKEVASLETEERLRQIEQDYIPAVKSAQEELLQHQESMQDELLQKQKETYEKGIEFWTNTFQNAITGVSFDMKDALKQVAVGFAAEIANAYLGSPGFDITSPQGAGGALGQLLLAYLGGGSGGGGNGYGNIISNALGGAAGMSAAGGIGSIAANSGAFYAGASGELMPGALGSAGGSAAGYGGASSAYASGATASTAATYAGWAYAAYQNYRDWQGMGRNSEGSTRAVSTTAGTAIGAAGGAAIGASYGSIGGPLGMAIGAAIGAAIGHFAPNLLDFGGSQGAVDRKATENWIQDRFAEGTDAGHPFRYFGQSGQMEDFPTGDNFIFGDTNRWNESGKIVNTFWDDFKDRGAQTFNTLGKALAEILGLKAEEVGGQLGIILAENLGTGDLYQNLDNIKLFLDQVGISTGELTDAIFKMAEAGKISWHEFEVFRQSLEKIPAEGLAAAGDYMSAMQIMVDAQGRGAQALQGLQYLAVEAAEAGIESLQGLQQALLDSGADVELTTAMFTAFGQRGIQSIEDLRNATGAQLGGVIADIETITGAWGDQTEAIEGTDEAAGNQRDTFTGLTSVITKELVPAIHSLTTALGGLPRTKKIDVQIDYHETGDVGNAARVGSSGGARGGWVNSPRFKRFASGGIIKAPQIAFGGGSMSLLGEDGKEGILPLAMVRGKLGINATGLNNKDNSGPTLVYNIDARGAHPGVWQEINAGMLSMKAEILNETPRMLYDMKRRGML